MDLWDQVLLERFAELALRMESGDVTAAEIAEYDELRADRNEDLIASMQPGLWQVVFMYADEYEEAAANNDSTYDAQHEYFDSKVEALAFQSGLEWGDEPKYHVIGITEVLGSPPPTHMGQRLTIGEDS